MAALRSRCGHYIFVLFLLLGFFPRLISAVADWMSTILRPSANLECSSLEMQDPKTRQKSPSGHHRTTLSGHIFVTKARIDSRKKTCSNISSTCPDNMVNFGPLAADIDPVVWGTGFGVLAALLHGTLVVGMSQTLQP